MQKYISIALIGLLITLGVSSSQTEARVNENGQDPVCFCHNVNNNPHTICTDDQGQINGHTTHVNNGQDTDGECSEPSPSPSPSPCVSPSPNPSVSPSPSASPSPSVSPSPEPSDEPEPSSSPEPRVSPSPEPEGFIGLGKNGPSCDSNVFTARLTIKTNGQGKEGAKVTFNYKAQEKFQTTDNNGEAAVDFDFQGNGEISAKADGYPTQQIGVESATGCTSVGGDPDKVLGASTGTGQVLGASTMAETGSPIADLFNLVFSFGAGLIGAGVKRYAQKN